MKDQLIEIVFKDILLKKIDLLLMDLTLKGKQITSYYLTCDSPEIDWNNNESIRKIFEENDDFGLFIKTIKIISPEIDLSKSSIAVYKKESFFDLEINFELSELKYSTLKDLAEKLMRFSKSIADKHHITTYFCGIEPATDVDTRLFTNNDLGLLVTNNKMKDNE